MQDSKKKTDFCGVCGGDNSTCTDCQGNVRVDFVNNGTCGKITQTYVYKPQYAYDILIITLQITILSCLVIMPVTKFYIRLLDVIMKL